MSDDKDTMDTIVMKREAAAWFGEELGFRRLMQLMIGKYRSLGRIGGSVILREPNPAECEALSTWFRKDYTHHRQITVSVEQFALMLRETRFSDVPLIVLLEEIAGEKLISHTEALSMKEQAKRDYFNEYRRDPYDQSYFCVLWLTAILNKLPGTRRVHMIYENDPASLEPQMEYVLAALADLEQRNNWARKHDSPNYRSKRMDSIERLPLFAERITKNPHGFDANTELGRLFVDALIIVRDGGSAEAASGTTMNDDDTTQATGSEALTELYYNFGILRDDLLNFTSCAGLTAVDHSGEDLPVWRAACKSRSVLNVPIREMVEVSVAFPDRENLSVYVVENSGVFSAILDQYPPGLGYPPLVCTHGQFKLASLLLLDRLVTGGATIYYSGDFDPEGLLMAELLIQRYPDRAFPWHFSLDDYSICQSDVIISAPRLKKLNRIRSASLMPAKDAIIRAGKAGYQEALLQWLLADVMK
ncbi:MAG: TIGR02679 domain-containing protein [Paenibacillaceae bacterium]